MSTQIKTKKSFQEILHPYPEKKFGNSFEDNLIGYNFLRNIWGTYFFDRQQISSEDKLDHINKIVGMMKAQIKLMITHQSNIIDRQMQGHQQKSDTNQNINFLKIEHQKLNQSLQRSKMRIQQLESKLISKQNIISSLQIQQIDLKQQAFVLKQQKNRCEQKIIQLSNIIYNLQVGCNLNQSIDINRQANTLDQYSAISIDKQIEKQNPVITLFNKRQQISLDFMGRYHEEIYSQQQNAIQNQDLRELNQNDLLRNKHPLRQSLQIYDKAKTSSHHNFIEEMKKMKLKTQRIVQIQNDRMSQREIRRKTFASSNRPLNSNMIIVQTDQRRFRRIRA